jgi:hypothetical protein
MSDDGTVKSTELNSLSAYLQWRDSMIADGVGDVNPFRVWSAGVRYATLTDAEREAVEGMAAYFDTRGNITLQAWGSLLRVLLMRWK